MAECPDALYLYALTLYRQGKYKSAFNRTADLISHLGCAYIYARLCLHLGKHKEGIFRLVNLVHMFNEASEPLFFPETMGKPETRGAETGKSNFSLPRHRHEYESNRSIYPDLLALYHLLGDLYKATGDTKSSALNYLSALRHNAFDFEAFQELSRLGAEVKVKAIYKQSLVFPPPADSEVLTLIPNPFSVITPRPPKNIEVSTPRIAPAPVPDAPVRRPLALEEFTKPTPRFENREHPENRERDRLFRNHPELAPRSLKRSSSSGLVSPQSEPAKIMTKDMEAADAYLRRLFSVFAKSFKSFCKYDCYKAIRMLEALPENEKDTPWVLSKLGRLHYEIVNYKQSKRFFVRLRQLDRTRLDDMEYYSTLLWHLHRKVELTYLANELHDIDSELAITWCVLGNLFSLVREPDEAIRCFNRSIAIDPGFTYAHTLKGHEYFSNDNYERALDCFRVSLLADARHYNALYGIGMVYINLGEYQRADYHFRKAVAINPINIILICCVGMVLEKLGKKTLALRQYELANKLQPLSALPIFKKAQLLFSMQQFPQALKQFELVKELAPNEASVHFLLGQLYNIQNDKFLAIREFTIALNLDPKGNYLIREAMEMLKDS